MEKYSNN